MAKGTTIGCKRKVRNKVRLEKKGSDESDEDYKVSEDEEFDESEDEYCSSLVGDESEESLGEYVDDEEDDEEDEAWIRKKAKKAGRPKTRRGGQVQKKKHNNKVVRPTKRKVTLKDDEEEDDYDDYEDDYDFCDVKQRKKSKEINRREEDDDTHILSEEDDEFVDEKPKKRSKVSRAKASRNTNYKNHRTKNKITFREENEDGDYDDDEEFAPYDALERVTRRMRVKKNVVTRQNRSDTSKDFNDDKTLTITKKKRTGRGGGRRRKYSVNSDSDIASSGSSDFEYTISEEEREQVREGKKLCRGLNVNLRSSSPLRTNNEEAQTKIPVKKGKEKVSDLKVEVVKQVCGICLSEEGKKTIRGVLNCCSHYFCFACIMEWSKVESRCPLCKQRFTLINRKVRSDGAHDLRDAVFHVPERDQVYQPSEEELRGYLDPYESVLCTECHLGGDDALMLLCDLCDSPAHTYCVGLGHEVPEGNWYCEGCRPAANVSSNLTSHDRGTVDSFAVNSSPIPTVRETFDLNEAYVPDTPLTQVSGFSQSPRTFIGDRQSYPSFPSGYAALTVFERRRIQRQIQQFLIRGRGFERNERSAHISGINLFGSRISPSRTVVTTQQTNVSIMPQNINIQGRSAYDSSSFCAREASSSSSRQISLRGQGNEASASGNISYGIGGGFVHHQLHPFTGISSNNGTEVRESTIPSRTLQGPVYTHHF